jgi:hypothetical protein
VVEQGDKATVHLEPWADGDIPLLAKLTGDPAMMEHLGGPESPEKIADRQARYVADAGTDPMFKIVDDATGEGVGSVGYWEREWRGQQVYETGWSVLPAFQGLGVAGIRSVALVQVRDVPWSRSKYVQALQPSSQLGSNMKWWTMSWRRPSKRSTKVAGPSGPSKAYSFSILSIRGSASVP